jgi:hypothetical protein
VLVTPSAEGDSISRNITGRVILIVDSNKLEGKMTPPVNNNSSKKLHIPIIGQLMAKSTTPTQVAPIKTPKRNSTMSTLRSSGRRSGGGWRQIVLAIFISRTKASSRTGSGAARNNINIDRIGVIQCMMLKGTVKNLRG